MKKAIFILNRLLLINLCVFVLLSYHFKLLVKINLGIGMALFISIIILELRFPLKKKLALPESLRYLSGNPLFKPVFIFLLSAIVSTIFSINSAYSQRVLFERFFPYCLFFILGCYLARSKKQLLICIILFMLGGLVIGIIGLKEYIYFPLAGRLYLLFGKPFNFTPFILFFLPLSYTIAFFAKNKSLKLLATVSIVVWALCFYWNNSRAVWVAAPLALLAISFLKSKRLAGILLIILASFFLLSSVSFKERASTTLNTLTWGGRLDLYDSAVKIYKDFPVFGAGLGTYHKLLQKYQLKPVEHLHAHNVYLEIAANMGTFGLLSFLWIFIVFFFILLKKRPIWKKRPAEEQAILLGLSASILASLIVVFATTIIIVGLQDSAIFWFFLGAASAIL